MDGLWLPLCGLSIAIFLVVIFFSKGYIKTKETWSYSLLIIFNLIFSFLATLIFVYAKVEGNLIVINILQRFYLCVLVTLGYLLFYYIYIICYRDNNDLIKRILSIGDLFIYVLIFLLPLTSINVGSYVDLGGVSYKIALISVIVYFVGVVVFSIIYLFKNNFAIKKVVPVIVLILLMIGAFILRKHYPELITESFIISYLLLVMFHTIENPDIRMVEKLEIEKDRAEKANAAKSDFLSSMSHEIRTPLNAIMGFSECIVQTNDMREAHDCANDVIGASQTLLDTVNGILDISKIESGKIELAEGDYNIKKLLNGIVKLIKARIGEKPLNFQVNIAEDIPSSLYGDQGNIKKVLLNLLTNAVKYTDEGYVSFDVKSVIYNDNCRLIFTVSDTGRGIKKEDIDKLFTKFQRLDEEKNGTIEGTGLGLAITKKLADMMHGSITVDSVYEEGSKFTFVVDQKISKLVVPETTIELEKVMDLSTKTIFVVDDNKLNLKVATKLLAKYQPIVTPCLSGKECIELIKNGFKFDLILLDDLMPGLSGVDTMKELRNIPGFNTIVVALTANAINGMKEKYLNDGFDDYLAKPIDKNELYTILKRYLCFDDNNVEMETIDIKQKEEAKPVVKPFVPSTNVPVINPGNNTVSTNSEVNNINYLDCTNKKVLIVDDNNLNIKVASRALSKYKFNIIGANSGIEAINIVRGIKFDLIFMDIMMPAMDGVQTLTELKKFPNMDTPIIALTADAIDGSREKYLKDGFDYYLSKPLDIKELDKVVNKYINK
ncbi:MAG TPA: response regulator [Bacilli bacterium]|nr:response regulator [Bacilli bacterium]